MRSKIERIEKISGIFERFWQSLTKLMIFEQLGNNNVVNNALINQKNEKTGKKIITFFRSSEQSLINLMTLNLLTSI